MSGPWVYIKSEAGDGNETLDLYTVGYHDPTGRWEPESDHTSAEAAAARVAFLNGGPPVAVAMVPAPNNRRAHNVTVRPYQAHPGETGCYCAGCSDEPAFKVRLGFREDDWTAYLCAGHLADLVGEGRSALGFDPISTPVTR